MSDEIFGERFYSHRVVAWHELGHVLKEPLGAVDAFSLVGSYDVVLEEITTVSGMVLPNRAIIRQATPDDPEPRVLGIVGGKYVLVPPLEVCQAWDDSVGEHLETMGVLYKGSSLFMTTFLPDIDVNGDEVKNYLLLYSPMSGMEAIRMMITPVRTVCHNTLIAARRESTEVYRVVHDKHAYERLSSWLEGIYHRAVEKAKVLAEFFQLMSMVRVEERNMIGVLQRVYPEPKPPRRDAPPEVITRREIWYVEGIEFARRSREAAKQLFEGKGMGMDVKACKGTAWGLYNAVCEWEDYRGRREKHQRSQQTAALFGDRARAKERAFNELLAVCTR